MISNSDVKQALTLSQSSYETSSKKLVASLSGTGWNALDNKDLDMSPFKFGRGIGDSNELYDNFNDQGFVATKGDTLAIVFTGSATSSILLDRSEISDWLTNIGAGVAGWDGVAKRYDELYDAAIDYAKDHGIDKIMVTGHSRGGAMAEYHYVKYSEKLKSAGLEMVGVSFASPGLKLDKDVDKTNFLAFEDVQDKVVDSVLSDVNNVTEITLDGPKTGVVSSHSLDDNYAPEVLDWLKLGPTDISLAGNEVAENSAGGTVVGTVSATDPNPGDVITLTMVDDAGGLFELDGDAIVVKGSLNFELGESHTVTIRAEDTGGKTRTESFIVDVTDVDEVFPEVSEGDALSTGDVNGVINQAFLTGDGSTAFRVTLDTETAVASNDNVLGVYEVNEAGEIVDTRLLFTNTNADGPSPMTVEDVEAGHKLGFFIVQDGADWADGLGGGDTFEFKDAGGDTADLSDGSGLVLSVNGEDTDLLIFHTIDASLNSDGETHVVSGEDTDGLSLILGMEDLQGGGDSDFQDVVFSVSHLTNAQTNGEDLFL